MAAKKKAKQRKQNKPRGHFCYVCGEHKANEKFSGSGHARHICKRCQAMPAAKRDEMTTVRKIDSMAFRRLSKTEIKWLRGKMDDARPEVRAAARQAYNMKFPNHDRALAKPAELKTPVPFSELDDNQKSETTLRLEELIGDFLLGAGYVPDDEGRSEILSALREEVSETLNEWEPTPYDPNAQHDPRFDFEPGTGFDERIARINEILNADAEDYDPYAEPEEPEPEPLKELTADDALNAAFDEIVARLVAEAKAGGIEFSTFTDTLLVAETERLKIRRFHKTDLDALWAIMQKPEVMYAWESGFKKSETRKWLNRQYTRYHKDGYGYFAATLKDTGRLIGQAGLMKSDINGETVVEIGVIFDDTVWGRGYAVEASRACVDLAFNRIGIDKLYATIRPENTASVRLAEKLGMRKIGEYIKTYREKEMPHDVFVLENTKKDREAAFEMGNRLAESVNVKEVSV
jgi:RimJ/RimL family protein N-acetyltransferase